MSAYKERCHEVCLICPKCGNELDNVLDNIDKDIKLNYKCDKCENEVYTFIYHHEIFYVKEYYNEQK